MAIGLRFKMEGGTAEFYDAIDSRLGIDTNPPAGLIFHSAGPIDGGWGIIDFWESREDFDRFNEDRLAPAIAAAMGDQAQEGGPDIKEFPVHNFHKP